ncbi:MAG TPA: holo-ACP synthase [Candidatus Acidoferrales bacterium]|nr:holo-ACP synthase [Candidatus Acidoferrales bacterium]
MVVSLGIDLIEVPRIRAALEDPKIGRRLRERVFTDKEIAYCEKRRRKHESYAARFAAKEAVMKALGHGWGAKLAWRDIEVVNAPGGAPRITLYRAARRLAEERGIRRLAVSLTHTEEHAMAFVIAESE